MKSARKTCDLDPVPISPLYERRDVLLPYITHVIKKYFVSGIVPTDLKNAIVRPLLKKPFLDPNCLKNYRPGSDLPLLSKITEKKVLSQLLDHLNTSNLLDPHQSAYRTGHSTQIALLKVVNDPSLLQTRERSLSCLFWSCMPNSIPLTIKLSFLDLKLPTVCETRHLHGSDSIESIVAKQFQSMVVTHHLHH